MTRKYKARALGNQTRDWIFTQRLVYDWIWIKRQLHETNRCNYRLYQRTKKSKKNKQGWNLCSPGQCYNEAWAPEGMQQQARRARRLVVTHGLKCETWALEGMARHRHQVWGPTATGLNRESPSRPDRQGRRPAEPCSHTRDQRRWSGRTGWGVKIFLIVDNS
jgi:hypothetical protein